MTTAMASDPEKRAAFNDKIGQLLAVPRTANGATMDWDAANASRARGEVQPAPQPEPPATRGFTVNRGQGASGDGTPPAQQQRPLPRVR